MSADPWAVAEDRLRGLFVVQHVRDCWRACGAPVSPDTERRLQERRDDATDALQRAMLAGARALPR